MWNVPPRVLCRQHLLGEHKETHMFVGSILSRQAKGWADNLGQYMAGLVTPLLLPKRHEQLVAELHRRGYNHWSPLKTFTWSGGEGWVDPMANLEDLKSRCPTCRERIEAWEQECS